MKGKLTISNASLTMEPHSTIETREMDASKCIKRKRKAGMQPSKCCKRKRKAETDIDISGEDCPSDLLQEEEVLCDKSPAAKYHSTRRMKKRLTISHKHIAEIPHISINPGLPKPSKYLKRKAETDISISSDDCSSDLLKRRSVSYDGSSSTIESCEKHELHNKSFDTSNDSLSQNSDASISSSNSVHSTTAWDVQSREQDLLEIGRTSGQITQKHVESTTKSTYRSRVCDDNYSNDSKSTSSVDDTSISLYSTSDNDYEGSTDDSANMNKIPENCRFVKLMKRLHKNKTNEIIDVPMVVTEAEVLLAVLKLSNVNSFSQTDMADTFDMLNNFIGSKRFPGSRYLVNEIFNSDDSVEYHANCPKCHKYITHFTRKDRRLKCTLCNEWVALKSPTYTDFFVLINIENEIRTLLEENSESLESIMNSRNEKKNTFSDIVDGLCYQKFMQNLPENIRNDFISLHTARNVAAMFLQDFMTSIKNFRNIS